MKKILTTMMMAVVAMTAMAELHPIHNIPVDRSFDDVVNYVKRIGYSTVVCDSTDGDGWRVYEATNPKDKSTATLKGYDNIGVERLWIKWKTKSQMPQRLRPVERLPYIYDDGYYCIGKWENYFVFNRYGGNFLDPYDPDYLEPDER